MNKVTLIFPVAIMALQLCACIVYFSQADIRKGAYWGLAFGLSVVVTF